MKRVTKQEAGRLALDGSSWIAVQKRCGRICGLLALFDRLFVPVALIKAQLLRLSSRRVRVCLTPAVALVTA